MDIVFYYPVTAEGAEDLGRTAAQCHAGLTADRIDSLCISKAKKEELLERVISCIMSENTRYTAENPNSRERARA